MILFLGISFWRENKSRIDFGGNTLYLGPRYEVVAERDVIMPPWSGSVVSRVSLLVGFYTQWTEYSGHMEKGSSWEVEEAKGRASGNQSGELVAMRQRQH